MILAGLYTGQRLKDIASLTWANVDMERGEIRLSTSKTGRHQVIPIASPLRSYLAELPVTDLATAPLFPNAFRIATNNLHVGLLSRHFGELLASAGLAKAPPETDAGTGKGRHAPRDRNPFPSIRFGTLRRPCSRLRVSRKRSPATLSARTARKFRVITPTLTKRPNGRRSPNCRT